MTSEEAIKILKSKLDGSVDTSWEWTEAVRMAIEALADRPTESDFISKAKVLETYSELYWFDIDCGVVSKEEVDKIYERLQSLPSAEPKTGEWVGVEKDEYEGFSIVSMRCNQCGRYAYLVLPKGTKCVYDYCPWCKADMRGEEE